MILIMANAIPAAFILLNFSLNKIIPNKVEKMTTKTFVMAKAMELSNPGLAKKRIRNNKN